MSLTFLRTDKLSKETKNTYKSKMSGWVKWMSETHPGYVEDGKLKFPLEDDESIDAAVEDNSAARADLHWEISTLVQSVKALLVSRCNLPKATRDEECQLAIYELEDFIRSRDTAIKPAARAHAFIRRAVRLGHAPSLPLLEPRHFAMHRELAALLPHR
jgi:hypothetical protein